MWRGGLSGPKSVFVHAYRPLISRDLSSPVLHELVHTVMGARSGADGDWVVEGLAELYSLELLVRSKTVSRRRYAKAMLRMKERGRGVANLAAEDSGGAITARAVVVLHEIDEQIEEATDGESGLDEVLRRLCAEHGVVSTERFRRIAEEVAGRELPAFARSEVPQPARTAGP
jgi:predicted metalloprotease with PDZ domain